MLYNNFPHYFKKGHNFRKEKVIEYKICFDFLYKFVSVFSHSKKKGARCNQKLSSCRVSLFLSFLKKNSSYFRKILQYQISKNTPVSNFENSPGSNFEKYSNIKFRKYSSIKFRIIFQNQISKNTPVSNF